MSNTLITTPNQLGSGNLPSGYDEVVFTLSDGNWTKNILLPTQPSDKSKVVIRSSAGYTAQLDVTSVDIPLYSLPIKSGCEYKLQYTLSLNAWLISGTDVSYLTPNEVGVIIPESTDSITFYSMEDGNWTPQITLPVKANDGAFIIIRSRATYFSKVSNDNMLYASTTQVITDDEYVFKYLSGFNGWVVDSAPNRMLNAGDIKLQLPTPTSQKTTVYFSNANWIEKIKLPETAGDRDKISLKSAATFTTTIDSSNVNLPGVMKLHTDEQYDFFYIAENKKWQLMMHPHTVYQAKDIPSGNVPELNRPRTFINFSNGNWQSMLTLPSNQQEGTRIVVQSSAEWGVTVLANNMSYSIANGEIVAFKVDENHIWIKETITINLLLVYSDKAAFRLGESVMRNRLIEAFNLTNEALENSGANFRYRMRGINKITAKDSWKTLGDPLSDLRSDPIVQGWRDSLKADGVYYEGTEDGCGLAWVKASSFNMVATGSINCGTTVMRHELGHNMGLQHAGESSSYNQGYGLLGTIMGGNALPYYATPHRYTLDYGIPMGIPDKIDAVRAMNEFSSTVAAYR
ncbi:M12 family metallo-peptidase [Rahnella variigena]|jgi:predicted chitinase|uniref:M12 family metallo-peptidase n=1 Tax=Rahnella variigena TaxID=574964 RepID=UPI000DE9F399|nr:MULTISPECIES: M12 family metallo-peptidase [Rahnella]RBQ33689.1 hypothetical protein C2125_13575 [Rahnella aquatilis]